MEMRSLMPCLSLHVLIVDGVPVVLHVVLCVSEPHPRVLLQIYKLTFCLPGTASLHRQLLKGVNV